MLALELIAWWYHRGWQQLAERAHQRILKVSHLFSVPILLRTLLAPWRRVITYPGASIDARLRALGDNMVSRAIGFTVRTLVLITALLVLCLATALSIVQLLVWPLIPIGVILLIVKAVTG